MGKNNKTTTRSNANPFAGLNQGQIDTLIAQAVVAKATAPAGGGVQVPLTTAAATGKPIPAFSMEVVTDEKNGVQRKRCRVVGHGTPVPLTLTGAQFRALLAQKEAVLAFLDANKLA